VRPPVLAPASDPSGPPEGRFLLADVYRGLGKTPRGSIEALRIVAVPPKTHPTMDFPSLGVTRDDPGKCVLGTVPVEEDGSAYFRAPAGVIVFFQALDARGVAVQTMRSATHVQPGQTLGCIGCHERRQEAPSRGALPMREAMASGDAMPLRDAMPSRSPLPLAARREPSRIVPGPDGSWPLRFDRLVQPVLDARCVCCHSPGGERPEGESRDPAKLDLTAAAAYASLVGWGTPSLRETVLDDYRRGYSTEGAGTASRSALLRKVAGPEAHHGVRLDALELERLIVWMDTYAQRLGSFSPEQERELVDLRERSADLLRAREILAD
jgi:hypothetical protein